MAQSKCIKVIKSQQNQSKHYYWIFYRHFNCLQREAQTAIYFYVIRWFEKEIWIAWKFCLNYIKLVFQLIDHRHRRRRCLVLNGNKNEYKNSATYKNFFKDRVAREYSLTLKGELSVWPDLEKFCQFGEMSIKYLGSFEVNIKFCFF